MAGQRRADRLAGVGVPQPHRAVGAAGGDAVPVGAERHTGHRPVWPVSGAPIGWPVSASHSRTVLSQLPEAMRCPSGLNATLGHRVGVAGQRRADRLAGGRRPTPAPSCRAAGDDARCPSGLNATLVHSSPVSVADGSERSGRTRAVGR